MTSTTAPEAVGTRTTLAAPSLELIGQFLEDVDYAGPVNRTVLAEFAPLVAAAIDPSHGRWRLAVELTRNLGGDHPAPVDAFERVRAEHALRRRARTDRIDAFIRAFGHKDEITDELRERYLPVLRVAGQPGMLHWRAAVHVINQSPNHRPPADIATAVADAAAEIKANNQRRHDRLRARVAEIADAGADEARAYIRARRAETGQGPTWYELARHLGSSSDRALVEGVVQRLHETGVVVSTDEPRSLDAP